MLLTLEAITQKRKHERPNERTNANDRKANTFGRRGQTAAPSLPLSLLLMDAHTQP